MGTIFMGGTAKGMEFRKVTVAEGWRSWLVTWSSPVNCYSSDTGAVSGDNYHIIGNHHDSHQISAGAITTNSNGRGRYLLGDSGS